MDNTPLKEQLIIDELVEFWQTYNEPRDLYAHICSAWSQGYYSLHYFFLTVRTDLRADKRSKYAASSAFEFRQFLEVEYHRLYQSGAKLQAEIQAKAEAERLAQMKAESERQAQIRAEFDALGELMAKTTDRKESIVLARKREYLAPYTGRTFVYENHCWKCKKDISSAIHARCKDCRWYICSNCASCGCGYNIFYEYHDEVVDRFFPDFPDD